MSDDGKKKLSSRRHFLGVCVGVSAGLILPAAYAHPVNRRDRVLSLYNTHTGEKVKATYWSEGEYISEGLREIEWLLRDHRAGKSHVMDKRVLDALYALQCKIDCQRPFHIISGYRSAKTNAMLRRRTSGVAKKSYHIQGRAIDIRMPRFDTAKLRQAALSLKAGGVGYYPRSNFVHIDTGEIRSW
ncbi:MAG: DUF882 domain-containing protein [Gammaproteobacteria bacterium]|nr:DUF882 domain-containing protein [Gammaproteobacteria bacterium]